ncbi:hypothetical protein JTB14_007525 [Gonioctena quinquepunctata]|nr:hypothetical protein JTB14_007525 [Gonioctena quinquepunctata]
MQSSPLQSNSLDYELFIQEYDEKKKKIKTVIVYNIAESQKQIIKDKIDDDINIMNDLMGQLVGSGKIEKVIRIGKIINNRPRPIKVILDSPETAIHILKNKSNLKDRQASVRSDLTLKQRNHLNELRSELELRKAKGENVTIRYVHGTPRIISLVQKD